MTTGRLRAMLVLAVLLPLLAAACSQQRVLQGADQAAVLAYAEPMADNLLQAMNSGDYAAFSRDFDSQMKSAIPAAQFQSQLLSTVTGRIGNYVSRTVTQVVQTGDQVTVIYAAKFDKADGVTITLTLTAATPHQVSGLYFNSPSLK